MLLASNELALEISFSQCSGRSLQMRRNKSRLAVVNLSHSAQCNNRSNGSYLLTALTEGGLASKKVWQIGTKMSSGKPVPLEVAFKSALI